MLSARRRVAKEAKKWDRYYPGWYNFIDTNELDLSTSNKCLMGQTIIKDPIMGQIGMFLLMNSRYVGMYTDRDLEKYWIEEIERRRGMEIGNPEREIEVVPQSEPIPEVIPMEEPNKTPAKSPAKEPVKEPVKV